MRKKFLTAATLAFAMQAPHLAHAQSIKDQMIGAWTLVEGTEVKSDGTKLVPWTKGSLIVEPSGHLSFIVLAKNRPRTENVRIPVGQMVAWYGTYTVDEARKGYTAKIEGASWVPFEGAVRDQTVVFSGDTMTTTGSKVATPEGEITPVNTWRKVK